jgi:translocation protein SEC62
MMFLQMMRVRDFDEAGYFTWLYEGDETVRHLMTAALVMGFLFCVCFPIWPQFLRVFVWYLSVTLLLFIFFLITSRALLFLFVWIVGWECWFLPNLFDESLGFAESFKPVVSCDPTKQDSFPTELELVWHSSRFVTGRLRSLRSSMALFQPKETF